MPKQRKKKLFLCFAKGCFESASTFVSFGKLKRIFVVVLLCFTALPANSQKNDLLSYDPCSEFVSKSAKQDFNKAFNAYKKGEFNKSVSLLRQIIDEQADFASPFFLMGIIGVAADKPEMIERYMPKVVEICPEHTHPLLYYYLGVIEYSNNNFAKAVPCFEKFFELNEQEQYEDLQTEAINYIQWCEFLSETTEKHFPFTPRKIDGISTNKDETCAFITHDQKQIYFIRKDMVKLESDESFYRKTEFKETELLCRADENEEGEFDMGFSIDRFIKISDAIGKVSLTNDNKMLYFSKPFAEDGEADLDLFVCENIEENWSEPKRLTQNINANSANDVYPSISPDGNTLYFASNRQGGYGGYDIYVSRRGKDGLWEQASNMGRRINTPADEINPFIHADNHSFYFSSDGWKTIGEKDYFYIDLDDVKMKQPINIGSDINTENDESNIGVLIDGQTAYASVYDQLANNYDVSLFPIPENVSAESVGLVKGRVIVEDGNDKGCDIKLYAKKAKTSVTYSSNVYDGEFVLSLVEKERYLMKIEKEGYEFCASFIDVNDTVENLNFSISQLIGGESYFLPNIVFDESNSLTDESLEILNEFVLYLKSSRFRIEIFAPGNQAETIAEYIIKSGVRKDRIAVSKQSSEKVGYRLQ